MLGNTISHYRILEKLGQGGMGVVYRAEDTRLGRAVALKFLPPELSEIPEATARFRREARAVSRLQHNNICSIHEIDETPDGQLFLSMDCYEGETLRERLLRGPLAVDEVVSISVQIAQGLHHAHKSGVVHRDLKPGNLMITPDGVVKILDFGLARTSEETRVTRAGAVVGTVAYMSPEQAQGLDVDQRTDLWSLGAVMYEMLTGTAPFHSETSAASIHRILHDDPVPVSVHRSDAPPVLETLVQHLLTRNLTQRCSSAELVLDSLVTGASNSNTTLLSPKSAKRRISRPVLIGVIALIIVGAAFATWALRDREAVDAQAPSAAIHKQITFSADAFAPDLSPDAKSVAFIQVRVGEDDRLLVQDVTRGQPIEIYRGDLLRARWSPSGEEILLLEQIPRGSSALILPRLGGTPQRLSVPIVAEYGCWSPDGEAVAIAYEGGNRIAIVEIATGSSRVITVGDEVEFMVGLDWSPRGDRLAVATISSEKQQIETLGLDGNDRHVVAVEPRGRQTFRWTPDGDGLVFLRYREQTTDLWTVAVDPETGERAGSPQLLLDGIPLGHEVAIANDASTLAYARETTDRQIWLLEPGDASSNEKVRARALTSGSRLHRDPSLSPDGQQVAFIAGAGTKRNVFITDLAGSEPRQVTFRDHCDGDLAWSPDGRTIAFLAEANGRNQVWTVDTVGEAPVPFVESFSAVRDGNIAWAPGSYIVYQRVGQKNFHQLDPRSGEEWPLFEEDLEGWVFDPRVAPDGNRVAFMWNRSPDGGVWLATFGDKTLRPVLTTSRHLAPLGWTDSGDELFILDYGRAPHRILRTRLDGSASEILEIPFEVWSRGHASPDGTKFVLTRADVKSDVWLVTGLKLGRR